MADLFGNENEEIKESFALADRMRPETLDDILGQEHLLAKGKPLRRMIERGDFGSMIFWGPPGSGKTTLAHVISKTGNMRFLNYSAVLSGIKEIKQVIKTAENRLHATGTRSILFIDEIHRFNKAQQDAFLPYVEKGTIILIGATTENPSFEIISPLLSRLQVYVLNSLTKENIVSILNRAIKDNEKGVGDQNLEVEDGVVEAISDMSEGDARFSLTVLESLISASEGGKLTRELMADLLQRQRLSYDKAGESHYNLISALHKSIRGTDPDAAMYWLVRMLEAGEDRLYILRRLIRMSMEDIGLADPNAVRLAVACRDAFHFLGQPEGDIALVQLAVYLACAPKSNSIYMGQKKVIDDIKSGAGYSIPKHIRNAPTGLMKELGYGKDYKYAHDYDGGIVDQSHLPEELSGRKYYVPTNQGIEDRIRRRLVDIEEELKRRKQ